MRAHRGDAALRFSPFQTIRDGIYRPEKLHHFTSKATRNQGLAILTKLKYSSDTALLEIGQPYGYPTPDSGKITNCENSVVDNVPIQNVEKVVVKHRLDMTGLTFFLKQSSRCFMSPHDIEFAGNDPDNERVINHLEETIERELCTIEVFCFHWGAGLSA